MEKTLEEHMREVRQEFAFERHASVGLFEDVTRYPLDRLVAMANLQRDVYDCRDSAERAELIEAYTALRKSVRLLKDAPPRIYLWPEDKMPRSTDYTDNSDYRYFHDPDFQPYLLEMLLPEDVLPKGAVVTIGGGEQGPNTLNECYQVGLEFNKRGYQCFILHCRPNMMPWSTRECGVDTARALRYIRANAERYRISPKRVAAAGFSNGGLAVDSCIQFYSGSQTVERQFPGYEPDALDAYPGAPDVQLSVYGARWISMPFDYSGVVYPPTFFAVGQEDKGGAENTYAVFKELRERGIPAELHTFAGHPHGYTCWQILDGKGFPNFDLWIPLADSFMQVNYKAR